MMNARKPKSPLQRYYHRWGNTDGAVTHLKRDYRLYKFIGNDRDKRTVKAAWKNLIRDRSELHRSIYIIEYRRGNIPYG